MRPPNVDVKQLLLNRANRYDGHTIEGDDFRSRAIQGDSRVATTYGGFRGKIDWVISSPPYYGMRTYGPDQWLRIWFLGGPSRPQYTGDVQISHASKNAFVQDLASVWTRIRNRASKAMQIGRSFRRNQRSER